jgi:hypothetical protein
MKALQSSASVGNCEFEQFEDDELQKAGERSKNMKGKKYNTSS